MLAHVQDALERLADQCRAEDLEEVSGWAMSQWDMAPAAVEELLSIYESLLVPSLEDEVLTRLEEDGVPLEELLLDEESANETVTRADLAELAASAWLVASEGANPTGQMLWGQTPGASMTARVPPAIRTVSATAPQVLALGSSRARTKVPARSPATSTAN
jgi:hypothetical protein